MNNDFREYSDYLMHYGVPGMKWRHHHYVVDQPRQIPASGNGPRGHKSETQNSFDRGVGRVPSNTTSEAFARGRRSGTQNAFDRGARRVSNNTTSEAFARGRRSGTQNAFDRGARSVAERPLFDGNAPSNSHTTAKPNGRTSRDYAAEYTYNTTGRSDNEAVGRMHKRLQKYGDANPNANLSSRRSRGLMTTLGVNHGGHHFSGDNEQEHSRDYDDHHLTSRIVKNQRKEGGNPNCLQL